MATKTVLLPHLGESVTEASVTEWLVKPGDSIERYTPLMEVVSDKVLTEVPSDFAGVVKEFLVDLDTNLPIGTALMTLEVEGVGDDGVPTTTPKKEEKVEALLAVQENVAAVAPEKTSAKSIKASGGRFSPAVLKISQERGIDLTQVTGTGAGGRITRKDVLNFTPETASSISTPVADTPISTPAPTSVARPVETALGDRVVPADGIRKAIATKMVQSVNEIPHAWMMVEADVSNIVALRNSMKDEFKQKEGISLSFFPFFAKAVVQALKKNPILNTSWQDGNIVYHNDINLSIAVTTDEHLFVPVIRQADNYSLVGLTKQINELAKEARSGTLPLEKMNGGTFTLNNTGSLGSVQSMGIINHPQAAILQVESINKRVVPTKEGGFKTADIVHLCLSIDHRILDGQQAGKFLKDVKESLAKFSSDSDIY